MQTVIAYRGFQINVKNFPYLIDGQASVCQTVIPIPTDGDEKLLPGVEFFGHGIYDELPTVAHRNAVAACKEQIDAAYALQECNAVLKRVASVAQGGQR
jgi:hypothetical protein